MKEAFSLFPLFRDDPPYNGLGWRDTGSHSDLLKAFCESRGISLYLFFGNWKVHASEGTSGKTLTCFQWDGHSYFAQNSHYYAAGHVVEIRREPARVRMERDLPIRKSVDFEPWGGIVREGVFFADDVAAVRNEWLREGCVPRVNCRGFRAFNSISRDCEKGACIVKQYPQFVSDIYDFMKSLVWSTEAAASGLPRCK